MSTENIENKEEQGSSNDLPKKAKSIGRRIANTILYSFIGLIVLLFLIFGVVHIALNNYAEEIVGDIVLKKGIPTATHNKYSIDFDNIDVKLIAGWSVHDFLSSGSITLDNVLFSPDSAFALKNDSLPLAEKENLVQLKAHQIKLQNISLLRALFQKEIYVGNIAFDSVSAEIHKYKHGKTPKVTVKDTDKEKFDGLKKFFDKQSENFNRYRVGNIFINNSDINFIDHTKSKKQQVRIGNLTTKINDIYLDSTTLYQELVPIHISALDLTSEDLKVELEKSPIGISLRKFTFSSFDSSLTIYNTSLYKISDNEIPLSGASIPLLSLEGIDISTFLYDSILNVRRVEISQPRVELNLNSSPKVGKKKKSTPQLPQFLKRIQIDEFSLNNANIPLESDKLGKREVKDLTTHVYHINVDNATLKKQIPLAFNYFDVQLRNQYWGLKNGHYIRLGSIYYNSNNHNLKVYRPLYSPYKVSKNVSSKAKIKASAKSFKLSNINYIDFLKKPLDSILVFDEMEFNQPKVEVWLPKKKTEKPVKIKKDRKHQFIQLNSTAINNAKVTLHLPNDSIYDDKGVTAQNLKVNLDTLLLPVHDPLNFQLSDASIKVFDTRLKDIKGYDLNLEKASFTLADSTFEVHGINVSSQNTTKNKVKVNTYIDQVFLENISWKKFIETDSLIVNRIYIEVPSADVKLPLKELQDQLKEAKVKEEIAKNNPQKNPFKFLKINQLHFRKGPLSVYNPDQSLLMQSSSTGLDLEGFEMSKDRIDWNELFFVLNDLYFPLDKIHHQARVSLLKIDAKKQDLLIDGITIIPTQEKLIKDYHVMCGINEVNIKGLDYHLLTNLKQVVADEINIDGLRGIISLNLVKKDSTKVKKAGPKEIPLNYINIGKINLSADDIALLVKNKPQTTNFATFYGGKFELNNIKSQPDSIRHISKITPEDFYVTLKGLQLESDENPMKFTSSLIVADSKGDSIYCQNTDITPKLAFQKVSNLDSLMSIAVGDLKIKGAGIKSLLYEKKIDVDSVLGKNIYYITPVNKKKKKVTTGSFAGKNFPKEKVDKILNQFQSIHVGYIDIDSSQISFRRPKKKITYSRLMERDKEVIVLKEAKINESKIKRKSEKIKRSKKLSKEEKIALIDKMLQDTIGQTIEIYPLSPSQIDNESNNHKESLISRSSENTLKNIHVTIKDFDLNKKLLDKEHYIGLKSAVATLGQNSINLGNGMYALKFDSLNYNSHYQDVYVKNFKVDPKYSKKDFGVYNEFQTDRIEVSIPDLLVRGIHLNKYVYRDSLHLNGIEVDQLNLSAYRDKSIPADPFKKKPKMPHTIFEDSKLIFNLDSITITDSSIDYEEFKGAIEDAQVDTDFTGGKSGQFQLQNFTGQIFNLTNNTTTLDSIPFAEMFVKGTLMNEGGDLKMYFRIPPLDSLGTYYYEGEVGEMDLVKLNPLIERLEMVKVKDGHLKRMYFKVLANDSLAVGNMQFRYKNLEVDVLKDKEKKDGNLKRNAFFSSVANLLIREENPRFPSMKQGHIYNVRNQNKFIFNYWAKTVLSGVASTLSPLMEPNLKFEIDPITKEVLRKRTPEEIKELKVEIRYIEKNTKRKQRLKGPLKKVY